MKSGTANIKIFFNKIVLSLEKEDPEELKKILHLAPIAVRLVEFPAILTINLRI